MSPQPLAELGRDGGSPRASGRRATHSGHAEVMPASLARRMPEAALLERSGGVASMPATAAAALSLEALSLAVTEPRDQTRGRRPGQHRRIEPAAVAFGVHAADRLIVIGAGLMALAFQDALHWPFDLTTALAAMVVLAWAFRLPGLTPHQLYNFSRAGLRRQLAAAAFRMAAPFAATGLLVLILLPVGAPSLPGLLQWLGLWAFGAVIGVVDLRLALAGLALHWHDQGRLKEAVAIYGTGDVAERLLRRLAAAPAGSVEIIGIFDDRGPRRIASPLLRSLTRGSAADLIELSRQREIDRVVVALPHAAERRVLEVLNKLRHMPVEISLAPDLAGFNIPVQESVGIASLPLLAFYRRPLSFRDRLAKNAFDQVAAALALVLLSPVLLAVAVAIKLDSPGPVLFRQNRYGYGNRVIHVFKFRSMHAHAADPNGLRQAEVNDPRITRIGHFLRRWSLDELPQLFNVLRGEMSLVGPRPHAISMRVEEKLTQEIIPDYALRHHLKPGITGWAQVNGYYGPCDTEEHLRGRVAHDLEYIERWSLWFDLWTILLTVKLCLRRRHSF